MALYKLVRLNGIDVSSQVIDYQIELNYQDLIDAVSIDFPFAALTSLVTPTMFMDLKIYESDTLPVEIAANRKFWGEVNNIESNFSQIKISAFSKLWIAVNTQITKVYDQNIDPEGGVGSEIFKDLCSEAGLNYDNTTIQSTGNVILLPKFVCNRTDVFERMQCLCDIYGFQFYYRPDTDFVYFEPAGFASNPNIFYIGGSNNVVQTYPTWKNDVLSLCNKVEIDGATQLTQITETFSGDGATKVFTLQYQPNSTHVLISGVEKKGGVPGVTSGIDYYLDTTNNYVIFLVAPPAGTNNIVVQYAYPQPTPVIMKDFASYEHYGRWITRTMTYTDILSVTDAENRGRNFLAIYAWEFLSTTAKVLPSVITSMNLKAGQSIRVIDARQNIDEWMLVKRITLNYPNRDVEVDLGDMEWRIARFENDAATRLKRLEEEMAKTGDIVNETNDLPHTISVKKRYMKITNQTITSSNIFILGHPTYGILGSSHLGASGLSSESPLVIYQGHNDYTEDFHDNDFKDASTTANWNNSTHSLIFTAVNQFGQSTSVDYNNGTITNATLTATGYNANFTLYLSANGGTNWETTSNGVSHTFSHTGTDLRWKIVLTSGSSGTITKVKISNYH